MRKLSLLLLALLICASLTIHGAFAEPAQLPPVVTSALLGTWEGEFEEYGVFTMIFGSDGNGESFLNGESAGGCAVLAQGNILVSVEDPEEGSSEMVVETAPLEFIDETTIRLTEDGQAFEMKRVTAPESGELTLDNAFLGVWEADIPSVGALMTFEFLPNGCYIASMEGQSFGESAYLVRGNVMVTVEGGSEVAVYTFEVVDDSTINVTEDGVTVPFMRKA